MCEGCMLSERISTRDNHQKPQDRVVLPRQGNPNDSVILGQEESDRTEVAK